jgi:tetratricopeptide (TPR) repeat protein/SAM-dependent methyltransferase
MPTSSEKTFGQGVASFQAGKLNDAEQLFKKVLRHQPKHVGALNLLGVLLTHCKRYAEAEPYVKSALQINSSSDATFHNYGIILKALKRPVEALECLNKALAINNTNVETWNNCGAVLNDLKRYDDAIVKFDRAIKLQPSYSEAFANKAKSLALLRRYDEASAMYEKALTLKPDLAEAWLGRGNISLDRKRYDEARNAYIRALSHKPNFTEARCALASLLLSEGNIASALNQACHALAANETLQSKFVVAACLRSPLLHPGMGDVRELLLRAITEPWGRPAEFASACARFLVLNDAIRDGMTRTTKAWPNLLPAEEPAGLLAQFAGDRLLLALLETTSICDLALERFATSLRFNLLTAARSAAKSCVPEPVLGLYCALARQCFINNYVFAQSNAEIEQAQVLRDALIAGLESGAAIPVLSLVAAAAYGPLHTLPGASALLDRPWPNAVRAVLEQQVRAPIEEQELRVLMPVLTAFNDDVSIKVRDQYEESPYPQWLKTAPADNPQTVDVHMRERFPLSRFVALNRTGDIDILIAGCGTGQNSIDTARRFDAAQVLAIDLSLSSLCYAQRQTHCLGLSNILYAQADIMKLSSIGRAFDVIESSGVLHHLADPLAGWQALLSILRPNGLMLLGFYSEIARRDVVGARNFIAARGYHPTADDMRRCRQELFDCADGTPIKNVIGFRDFFNLNEFRDLLFHSQEHRMTIPQIASFIAENDLQFLGFETDLATARNYARQFPADVAMTDLAQWHRYETDNPLTFRQMYQFWVQRK